MKSESIAQIANELDYNFVKLNLAQITETGDLAGYPICLHYACNEDLSDCQWIAPELIDSYVKGGYHLTPETKMSYALPEWYKNLDPDKGTILLLDDASRALPNILQACYELIYKQEFWSFKLPPRTTVILTTNPNNGDYNVNEVDEAGHTRLINFSAKFDIGAWAAWAEAAGLDGRTINFMLCYHSELMEGKNHTHIMNARSYTMFAKTIAGITKWENPSNLGMILQIASGCFNDKDNVVGSLFTTFVANKLDKLIPPEDLLLKPWETVEQKIRDCVYEDGVYKPHIASILSTRLLNYSMVYFGKKGAKTEVVQDRLIKLIDCCDNKNTMLFAEDLLFNIIKELVKNFPARTNKLVLNPKIRKQII